MLSAELLPWISQKKNFIATTIFIVTALTVGCQDKCANNDCPYAAVYFVVTDASGNNLYQTPMQKYFHDSLTVRGLTSGADITPEFGESEGSLHIGLESSTAEYIIGYNLKEFDTLTFEYTYRHDECCGKVIDTYTIHRNGNLLCEGCQSETLQIIR